MVYPLMDGFLCTRISELHKNIIKLTSHKIYGRIDKTTALIISNPKEFSILPFFFNSKSTLYKRG